MLAPITQIKSRPDWLNNTLFEEISTEHFRNTDWTTIPDKILAYVFLHDEPTYKRQRTEGTKKEYLRDLLSFLAFSEAFGGIRHLALEDMLVYQDTLAKRYASTTFRKRVTVVKQFLHYIYAKGAIETDLTRLMKKVAQPPNELVNRDLYEHEVKELLEHFEKINFFMYALLFILTSTGLRIEELASAEWKKVYYLPHLGFHFLSVVGKGSKTREVALFQDLMPVITELHKRRGLTGEIDPESPSPFFPKGDGSMYNSKYLSNLFTTEIKATGLSFVKSRIDPITPHTCRHYYAAYLENGGAKLDAVREALGHFSIVTTQRYLWKRRLQENHAALQVGRTFRK
jgi:site-specific recombinase XerD